jgi:hypothetical protein
MIADLQFRRFESLAPERRGTVEAMVSGADLDSGASQGLRLVHCQHSLPALVTVALAWSFADELAEPE